MESTQTTETTPAPPTLEPGRRRRSATGQTQLDRQKWGEVWAKVAKDAGAAIREREA